MGSAFEPGVYNHYKGGKYTALCLATDHETRELVVVYVSHSTGAVQILPYATKGHDSWTDVVTWTDRAVGPRFVRVNDAEQPK